MSTDDKTQHQETSVRLDACREGNAQRKRETVFQAYICPVPICNIDVTTPSASSKFWNNLNQLIIAVIERGPHYKKKPYNMFKTCPIGIR
jgi:hypothetical protein